MSISFSYYETEALRLAARIRELKGLTPEFIEARDTAQRHVERHYALIEQEEATLTDLRSQAAEAALKLGLETEPEIVAEEEPEEAVSAPYVPDAPDVPYVPDAPYVPTASFAETITAALADMAINQPPLAEDNTAASEMTTEEVEAVEAGQVEAQIANALKAYG